MPVPLRSPARAALSLRTVLLLPALVAGVYAAGLSLYLTRRVSAASAALGESARLVAYRLDDVTGRYVVLDRALNLARELVTRPPSSPPDPGELQRLKALAVGAARAPAESHVSGGGPGGPGGPGGRGGRGGRIRCVRSSPAPSSA